MTAYADALREVASLILGLFTKRFKVLLTPFFHGRVFGK